VNTSGKPGEPGGPGEPGNGGGGKGGVGGRGGEGGHGVPQGEGGVGGPGGGGGRGAQGERGPAGEPGGLTLSRRVVVALAVYLLALTLGTGASLQIQHSASRQRCVEVQARSAEAAQLLPGIVAASRKDGDTSQAAFWNGYLVQLKQTPPAQC